MLFTLTHEMHHLPCPNPEVDRILSGRTCSRDLIMEMADRLAAHHIPLVLYYNHGIMKGQDPQWQDAVGSRCSSKETYFTNYCNIIRWMGQHYGKKVIAWWMDSAIAFREMKNVPFKQMTDAAREGNPERLVCYNPGLEDHSTLVTPYQDYWAGEVCRMNYYPFGELTPSGLPWYSFAAWHLKRDRRFVGEWGIREDNAAIRYLPPSAESVALFIHRFHSHGGAVTCNLLCYQDGSVLDEDLQVMKEVRRKIRGQGSL
ncbi:MAG TPA: hypothetical protein DD727_09420 [Clostridiales bacterium]|nr:hypothetical protein [Clostridiales bacterium]